MMVDLTKLSPPALKAAMKGGTSAWGRIGSSSEHVRYSEALPKRRGRRRKCFCGCNGPKTHAGKANGVALTNACELGIARWVRTGYVRPLGTSVVTPQPGARPAPTSIDEIMKVQQVLIDQHFAIPPPLLSGCSRCGINGLHACTGAPGQPWSEYDKAELGRILDSYTPEANPPAPAQQLKGGAA